MLKADITGIYRSSWAFALACPLLFAIPVLVEMAQHIVELQAGMYDGKEGALAAEGDPLRMQFGFIKTLALLLPGYWFTRFVMFDHDPSRAARIETPAFPLWLAIFAIMSVHMWLGLFGPSLANIFGIADEYRAAFGTALFIIETVVTIYLVAWLVAWPLGNRQVGPLRSLAIMRGSFWYSLALYLVGTLPLMILHYALAILAVMWLPGMLDWLAMAVDSLVVGLLALTMCGSSAYAARHAARKQGINLLPGNEFPAAAQNS